MSENIVLQAQNLCKSYGEILALNNVSFEVKRGEIFGLIGADGAGKTTLIRILATLLLADKGKCEILGFDFVRDFSAIRAHLGYMPAVFSLYADLSVEENLNFFANIFNVELETNYALIEPIYRALKPFSNRRAGALSGGMKQKLALCCALIHKPKILLLDEPAAFLDAKARQVLLDYVLSSASSQRLIIWASSDLEEAAYFSRWLQLDKGQLVSDGRPHLLANSGSLRAPWTRVLQDLNMEERQPITNWPVTEKESIDFLRQNWPPTSTTQQTHKLQKQPQKENISPIVQPSSDFTLNWQNVSFSYDGKVPTLNNINLTLQAPDCVAFCGSNGAGKTTLAKMSNGLLRPQQGALLINGSDTGAIPSWQLASQVGFIFHNAREQIFATDVWSETAFGPQNLGLTAKEVEQRCHEALEITHLLDLKTVHPYELSNAQLRRLTWASVLSMHTRAIVMDEPNAALDEESYQIFTDMLDYLRTQRKALVILITHNMDLVNRYCQKIVLLNQGELTDFGITKDVLLRHTELPRPSVAKFAQALQLSSGIIESTQLREELQASSSNGMAG